MTPHRIIPVPLVLCLLLAPRASRADDTPAAQALFDEGKALAGRGLYADACPKFEQSQKLDPGLGTQFHLADCWQHIGRNASAWAAFRDVEAQAHASRQPARERVARDRAAALEPFVSKVVVSPQAASDEPGLVVQRDGEALGTPMWNTAVPVDPGPHVVAASAPHKVSWQTVVDVPSEGKVVTVEVPPLVDATPAVAAAPPPPAPAPRPVAMTPPPPAAVASPAPPVYSPPRPLTGVASTMPSSTAEAPVLENRGGLQRAVGWFFVGAGVVGLGTAGYFGVKYLDDRNSSKPHCVNNQCDAYGANLRSDATNQERIAGIAAGAGAASLLVGVVLAATAPSPRMVLKPVAGVEVAPIIAAGQGGLAVHGAW